MDNIINFESAKEKINKSKSLDEISITRSFLMYAVVMIHFLNIPVSLLPNESFWQSVFYVFRGMLIFAVPSFMFISMIMISYGNKKMSLLEFYKKKLTRIFIPYIIWSILYQAMLIYLGSKDIASLKDMDNLLYLFLYGKSYEHLYFMPILIEFTIFAPILLYMAKKIKDKPPVAIAFAMAVQIGVYFLNKYYLNFPMLRTTFIWYFSVGFLGIWFGIEYEKNMQYIRKHADKILFLTSMSFFLMQAYQYQLWPSIWRGVVFNTLPYTINMHIYFILMIFSILILTKNIVDRKKQTAKTNKIADYMIWLSNYSYGVYFIHPIFTFVLGKKVFIYNAYLLFIFVFVGVIAVSHICAIITKIFEKLPIISLAFGKPAFPKVGDKKTSKIKILLMMILLLVIMLFLAIKLSPKFENFMHNLIGWY